MIPSNISSAIYWKFIRQRNWYFFGWLVGSLFSSSFLWKLMCKELASKFTNKNRFKIFWEFQRLFLSWKFYLDSFCYFLCILLYLYCYENCFNSFYRNIFDIFFVVVLFFFFQNFFVNCFNNSKKKKLLVLLRKFLRTE